MSLLHSLGVNHVQRRGIAEHTWRLELQRLLLVLVSWFSIRVLITLGKSALYFFLLVVKDWTECYALHSRAGRSGAMLDQGEGSHAGLPSSPTSLRQPWLLALWPEAGHIVLEACYLGRQIEPLGSGLFCDLLYAVRFFFFFVTTRSKLKPPEQWVYVHWEGRCGEINPDSGLLDQESLNCIFFSASFPAFQFFNWK